MKRSRTQQGGGAEGEFPGGVPTKPCPACGGVMAPCDGGVADGVVCLTCPLPVELSRAATLPAAPTDLIDTAEAREVLGGVCRDVLDEVVAAGGFRQYRISPRVIRYSKGALLRYLTTKAAAAGLAEARKNVAARRKAG